MILLNHHGAWQFGSLGSVEKVAQLAFAGDGEDNLRPAIIKIGTDIIWRGCEEGIEKCMAGLGSRFARCHFEVLTDNRVSNGLGISVNLTHFRLLLPFHIVEGRGKPRGCYGDR